MASKSKLEDLDLSQDEIKRLGDALKDEKFRKMFVEYAQEISDPENRKRYEEEIAQMENERGMDVNFVHPHAGYVLKTSINGDTKAFINICKNDKIGKPSAQRKSGPDGRTGVQWSIPHSFAPPRDDMDKNGKKCKIFDVVFHPDTYRMAETNERFRKLVDDTAVDGIEGQFGMKIDKKNIKRPKLKYKGMPTATIIRSRQSGGDAEKTTPATETDSLLKNFPYPYGNKSSEEMAKEKTKEVKTKEKVNKNKAQPLDKNAPTEPKYTITHRTDMDLQEYRNSPDSRPSTRPKALVIAIDLPLLNSAASVSLDILEKQMLLESVKPAAYRLELNLPYPVDDGSGSAVFDKGKHRLTVTLPLLPLELPELHVPTNIEESKSHDTAASETSIDGTCTCELGLNGNQKPLIEVLSSCANNMAKVGMETDDDNINETSRSDRTESDTDSYNETRGNNKSIWDEDNSETPSSMRIAYNLPRFTHRQDNETVSFVLDVKNVQFDTVMKLFPMSNAFHVRFVSVGSGCFPLHYSLYVAFPENCLVVPDHCSVDVSERNVVILVLKSREVRGLWDKFWVGMDENHIREKLFATEANLELELNLLEKEAVANEKMVQSQGQLEGDVTEVKVTEMSEKTLKINLRKAKKGKVGVAPKVEDEDLGEDEDLTSPDIQVIEEKHNPHLHGILKQRSRSHSESSDDVSSCYSRENSTSSGSHMSESPISESEEVDGLEGRLRKSVSFNDHVDKTTFKTTATVSSMKIALKSKRRRNRKKEEKKQRRRHNSNGSECSSSDEHPHQHSDNDVEDHEDAEAEVNGKMDHQEAGVFDLSEDIKPCDTTVKARSGQQDESIASLAEAYRTRPSGESVEKELLANEGSLEANNDVVDSPGANASQHDKVLEDVKESILQNTKMEQITDVTPAKLEAERTKHLKIDGGDLDRGDGVLCDNDEPELSSDAGVMAGEHPPTEDSPGQAPGSDQPPNGDSSESMLSWTNQTAAAASSDHKTNCAFSFSNSVMFDLDVD